MPLRSAATSAAENQLRQARRELEKALRAGDDARTESLLATYPALAADAEASLELAYTEFVVRTELGQNPTPVEWFTRFPQLKEDLEQVFQIDGELRKEEASRASRTGSRRPPLIERSPRDIAGYELLGELGRGGMGVVYKAKQTGLNRIVALKVILSGLHAGERDRARFRREAEAAARLDHPNIVRIYEVGEADGRPYCAMEFVEGGSLAEQLGSTPWSFRRAAEFVALLADAVQHAHDRGIVHRDLKPANILLQGASGKGPTASSNGSNVSPLPEESIPYRTTEVASLLAPSPTIPAHSFPKIADFGLAKFISDSEAAGPTRSGDLVGTPAFMAPEQALARTDQIGPATDIWALGVTLYEMLTGHLPFRGESASETLDLVRSRDPVPPRQLRANMPLDLQTICLKCLSKSTTTRYASAADLSGDLNRWLRGEPILARPVGGIERARRWCRRNPRAAMMAAAMALLLVSTLAFGVLALLNLADANEQSKRLARQEQEARQKAEGDSLAKSRLAQESQRRLTQLRVADGMRRLEDGDLTGGAVILAAALEADPDPAHDELHRIRLATTIRAMPALKRHQRFEGHTIIPDYCFSADGLHAITVNPELKRHIVDTVEKSEPRKVVTPTANIRNEALNGDGRVLARILGPRIAAVDLLSGQMVPLPLPSEYQPLPPPFSPDGSRHVIGFNTGLVPHVQGPQLYYRLMTYNAAGRAVGPPILANAENNRIRRFCLSHDGKLLATAEQSGRVRIWDPETGQEVGPVMRLDGVAQALQFSDDGTRIFAGSAAGFAQMWNTTTGMAIGRLIVLGAPIEEVCFSQCQKRVLTVSRSRHIVRLWDTQTGLPLGHEIRFPNEVKRVLLHPTRTEILVIGNDSTLRVWNAVTGDPISPPLHGASSGQYTSDGQTIVGASARGAIRAWDMDSAGPVSFLNDSARTCWVEDGSRLICLGRNAISLWGEKGESLGNTTITGFFGSNAEPLPDGRFLIVRRSQSTTVLQIWNPRTADFDGLPVEFAPFIRGNAYIADGRFAAWEPSGVIRFRSEKTGEEVGTSLPHKEPAWGFGVTIDGRRMITKGSQTILWDLTANKLIATLDTLIASRESQFLPDGSGVAGIDRDARLVIVESENGVPRGKGFPLGNWTTMLTIAPDGRTAATVNAGDRSVQVWNLADGRPLGLPLTHRTDISVMAFSPNGRFLASGTKAGIVQVWDVATGTPITPPMGHGQGVTNLAFRPDGRKLLANVHEKDTWIWDLTPDHRPAAELAAFTRLLANRKVDDRGVLVPLSTEEEQEHWRRFHAPSPP